MKSTLIALGLILAVTSNSFGKDEEFGTGLEVDNYKTLAFNVELDDEAEDRGLTQELVESKVMLQLRQNGIKPVRRVDSDNLYVLGLSINSVGWAYAIEFGFGRAVTFATSQKKYVAIGLTWTYMYFGTTFDNQDILDALEGGLDIFINAYLEANAD